MNFRSAGHVLYTASPLARLHTCMALENGATPAGRPLRVSFPLCGETSHRCWARGFFPAGPHLVALLGSDLPSGCPCSWLTGAHPALVGTWKCCGSILRGPARLYPATPAVHTGSAAPSPRRLASCFPLHLLGLSVSRWLSLVPSCCLVPVLPLSGSLCLVGLLWLSVSLSPCLNVAPAPCVLFSVCVPVCPFAVLGLPAPLGPGQCAGRMCHLCFLSVSLFPPSASLCFFLTLDGASPSS